MIFSAAQTEVISIALEKSPRDDDQPVWRELAALFHYYAARHLVRLAPALDWARAVGIEPPPDDDGDGGPNPAWDHAVAIGRAMQIAAFRAIHSEHPKLRIISEKRSFGRLIESVHPTWSELDETIAAAEQRAMDAGRRGEESSEPRPHHLPTAEDLELYDARADEMQLLLRALLWAISQRGYYDRAGDGGAWPRAAADVPAVLTHEQRQVAADLVYRLGREVGETQVYLPQAEHLAKQHNISIAEAEEALAATEQVLRWHYATCRRATADEFAHLSIPRELLAVRAWEFLSDQQQRGLVAAEQTLWQHIHRAQKEGKNHEDHMVR